MADEQQRELAELKHRRGWWASVIFMIVIIGLIIFLTYVRMVDDNREVIIGIIGMLTGSISSMLAIASGRDPSEIEELKGEREPCPSVARVRYSSHMTPIELSMGALTDTPHKGPASLSWGSIGLRASLSP